MRKILVMLVSVALVFAFTGVVESDGENWEPEREVRIVVPYGEGGASHRTSMQISRIVDEHNLLDDESMLVTSMPGAGTLEGQREVLNADPDGYTILGHHNAMVNNYAIGGQNFTYTDFEQIAQVYVSNMLLGVRADAPFDTTEDLVQYVEDNPGELNISISGVGGNTHFNIAMFMDALDWEFEEDVYPVLTEGGAQSVEYLVGDMVDIVIEQPASLAEYVAAGDVEVLGHTGEGIMEMFGEEIESLKAQNIDYSYQLRFLFHAPEGTPNHIIESLEDTFRKVTETEDWKEWTDEEGFVPEFLTSAEAAEAFGEEAEAALEIGDLVEEGMEEF